MKVVFQWMDKECPSGRVIADVGQIHPKTNREGLARFVQKRRASDLLAQGMAHSLLKILLTRSPEIASGSNRFYTLDVLPECSNDISRILFGLHVLDIYDSRQWQAWPDIQRPRADRPMSSPVKFQIQATW